MRKKIALGALGALMMWLIWHDWEQGKEIVAYNEAHRKQTDLLRADYATVVSSQQQLHNALIELIVRTGHTNMLRVNR